MPRSGRKWMHSHDHLALQEAMLCRSNKDADLISSGRGMPDISAHCEERGAAVIMWKALLMKNAGVFALVSVFADFDVLADKQQRRRALVNLEEHGIIVAGFTCSLS